jgi:hypothetical protein
MQRWAVGREVCEFRGAHSLKKHSSKKKPHPASSSQVCLLWCTCAYVCMMCIVQCVCCVLCACVVYTHIHMCM